MAALVSRSFFLSSISVSLISKSCIIKTVNCSDLPSFFASIFVQNQRSFENRIIRDVVNESWRICDVYIVQNLIHSTKYELRDGILKISLFKHSTYFLPRNFFLTTRLGIMSWRLIYRISRFASNKAHNIS